MKKIFVSVSVASLLLAVSPALAQVGGTDEAQVVSPSPAPVAAPSAVDVSSPAAVTGASASPRILPGTAGYFLKELVRGVERLVTFNPVKRAELELQISSEKAEEVKALDAANASDEALKKAVANYEANAARLKARLDALKQTSENPNVDRLLQNISERVVEHENIFKDIASKRVSLSGDEEGVKAIHDEVLASSSAKFASPEEFGQKLKEALVNKDGSDDTEIRALSLINRVEGKTPEEATKELQRVKEEIASRLSERAKLDKRLADRVSEMVKNIPSGEIRLKVASDLLSYGDEEVQGKIKEAESELEKEGAGISSEAARAAIDSARKALDDLAAKTADASVAESVAGHLEEARGHLSEAEKKFAEGKFGSAFGRARSAEAIATSVLRRLVSGTEELAKVVASLNRDYERLMRVSSEKGVTAEKHPEIFARFEEIKSAIASIGSFEGVKEVRKKMAELEVAVRRLTSGASSGEARFCPQVYLPVCGEDGKTYGNACEANLAKVRIVKSGACGSSESPAAAPGTSPEKGRVCTMVYSPVCGEDGKTYGNSCFAESAGVKIKRNGACEESEDRLESERKIRREMENRLSPTNIPNQPIRRTGPVESVTPEEYRKILEERMREGSVKPESSIQSSESSGTTPSSLSN